MEPTLIHTSDRIAFKNCRRAWNWSSPLRNSLRGASTPEALWFGTLVHHGLEAFSLGFDYQAALDYWLDEHRREFLTNEPTIEQEERYIELVDLAHGMLYGYELWTLKNSLNERLVIVGTEVRFRVPLFNNVFYVGKADALLFDTKTLLLWIQEFKTAAQFNNPDLLAWDEQCTSYAWAFESIRSGVGDVDTSTLVAPNLFWDASRVEGILYDDLRKKLPALPRVLQNGTLSLNKQQDTTYDVFLEYLETNGYRIEAYGEFLDFLKTKSNNFFRRNKVRRNAYELKQLGDNIVREAMDMCNLDLPLYPNPGYRASNCQRCAFQGPCLGMNDGQEIDLSDYIVKDSFDGDEFFETGSPKGGES